MKYDSCTALSIYTSGNFNRGTNKLTVIHFWVPYLKQEIQTYITQTSRSNDPTEHAYVPCYN